MHLSSNRRSRFSLSQLTERKVTLLAFLAFFIIIPGMFIPIIRASLDYVVSLGERKYAEEDVGQVEGLLQHQVGLLSKTVLDYAAWDDTYQFVQDRNQEYIDFNITDDAIANLGVDLVIITDVAGTVLFTKTLDPVSGEQAPPPYDVNTVLARYPRLAAHTQIDSQYEGLGVLGDQILMLASRPIITSQYQGPVRGSLIFGTLLSDDEVETISSLARRAVTISLPGSPGWQALPADARNVLGTEPGVYVHAGNNQTISGCRLLSDMSGEKKILLRLDGPRDLYWQGQQAALLITTTIAVLNMLLFFVFRPLAIDRLRLYQKSREKQDIALAVWQQSNEGSLLVDLEGRILELNPAARLLLGPFPPARLQDLPGDWQAFHATALQTLANSAEGVEVVMTGPEGQPVRLEVHACTLEWRNRPVIGLVLQNVLGKTEEFLDLRNQVQRIKEAVHGAGDAWWEWSLEKSAIAYSDAWVNLTGSEWEADPEEWYRHIHPDDLSTFKLRLTDHLAGRTSQFECEYRLQHADGGYRWMSTRGSLQSGNSSAGRRITGLMMDISTRKKAEELLRRTALHDPQTGLANRALLLDRLVHANERKKRNPDIMYGVVYLNLELPQPKNGSSEPYPLDEILAQAARRLEARLRLSDTVSQYSGPETLARVGGDGIVLLLEDFKSTDDAITTAERILNLLGEPFLVRGDSISLKVCLGLLIPDRVYSRPEDPIREANMAMYYARQSGQAIILFRTDLYHSRLAFLQLEDELRLAIDRDEFEMHYQPIVELEAGSPAGFEALIRWRHPVRGLLMPGEFLAAAGEAGLARALGQGMLRKACKEFQAGPGAFADSDLFLSVNLSESELADPGLAEQVRAPLEESGLDPRRLVLEITDTALLRQLNHARTGLEMLRGLGIRVVLDDFQAGPARLRTMEGLPLDGIKLTASRLEDLDTAEMVRLGHDMGLFVFVEQVETDEQKSFFRTLACEYGQGYLFARPVPVEALELPLLTI